MLKNKLTPLALKNVKIKDDFWSRYVELVHNAIIPYQWEIMNDKVEGAEPSHCIKNFKIAAGLEEGEFYGMVFQDTDLAKWLEAVAYSLEIQPNEKLEEIADYAIDLVAGAQGEDGYINTYYTIAEPEGRWTNLQEGHELYTAGHFIEAAVAYYKATGKDKLLKVMSKFVDYIDETFGYEEGKLKGYPGHQEIELALVRLYEITKEKKYLKLSKYFIDERGQEPYYFDIEFEKRGGGYIFPVFKDFDKEYLQAHLPVLDQDTAEGHSVRAVYMYAGMAELAYQYQDKKLLKACERLFDNIVERRMYLTGSIGSAAYGERFSGDYDLPNDINYSETCASIGLAMFSQRMLNITKDAKYADTMERALYNTVLSGISLKGTEFFYVNPLEVWPYACEKHPAKAHVETKRQKWFGVACCPPNIARTLASLGQYIYSLAKDEIYMNMFVENKTTLVFNEKEVTLEQVTKYPFQNTVHISCESKEENEFTLAIRIPSWCMGAKVEVDGENIDVNKYINKGYLYIKKIWHGVSKIEVEFDMPAQLIEANPKVRADAGKLAIVKGPLVYCLEEVDNGENLSAIEIAPDAQLTESFEADLLGGTLIIHANAKKIDESNWGTELYRPVKTQTKEIEIKAIPYCLWNNRKNGEMLVWINKA